MSIKNRTIQVILLIGCFLVSISINAQTTKRSTKSRASGSQKQSSKTNAEFNELVKQGDAAREAGRLPEAVTFYVKALKIRHDWVEGWWYVGTILYDGDKFADARDAFNNLVAIDPKKGTAWAMLGLCQYQTHEYQSAAVSLTRAREAGLDNNQQLTSVVNYHTAILYNRFDQFEIAFEVLREFVREGNESPKVIEAFGLAMLRMHFLPDEIPADKREQILLAGRGGFDMASRRLDEARKSFEDLAARYPNEPNVHYAYGVFLISQDADAAIKQFQRELEISPNHVAAMLQMAFEYRKRNEYEAALPLAEKSVQLAPKMYQGRNILGRVLLELGQVDRSIKELEEGIRLAPTSPEMHFALARAYTRAGRKEDADREREIFKQLEKQSQQQGGSTQGSADEKPGNQSKPKPE